MHEQELHVVAIGGGGGASQVLRAAQPFASRLSAVIAVTDTGRSTGLARAIGSMPAPGDLRSTIAAFATDRLMAQLLDHRFDGAGIPQLEGMAFGNLLIAALTRVTGDFGRAVEVAAELAGCAAEVLPVSTADAQLCAVLEDGTRVEGELQVRGLNKPPIARVFLREPAAADPRALAAIRSADLVALGPGSLFTTILACLAFEGVAEALRAARGRVVYICNTTTQPGQTDGLRAADHVRHIVEAVGPGALDAVLVNSGEPSPETVRAYAAQGLHLLRPGADEIAEIEATGVQALVRPLIEQSAAPRALWNKQDTIRHDVAALGDALRELVGA